MGEAGRTHGEMRDACKFLVGTSEWKRPLGRPRRRWDDNIKIIFKNVLRVGSGFIWLRIGAGGGLL
jgi:hypothetical protein